MNQTLDFALEDESDLYFYQMMHRMNWLEAEKLDAQAGKNRTAEQSKSYARLLHWLNVQNNRNRRKFTLGRVGWGKVFGIFESLLLFTIFSGV